MSKRRNNWRLRAALSPVSAPGYRAPALPVRKSKTEAEWTAEDERLYSLEHYVYDTGEAS